MSLTKKEVLGKVQKEFARRDAWKVSCIESRKRILELFKENGIPETEYEPWMCNNVLPEVLLK